MAQVALRRSSRRSTVPCGSTSLWSKAGARTSTLRTMIALARVTGHEDVRTDFSSLASAGARVFIEGSYTRATLSATVPQPEKSALRSAPSIDITRSVGELDQANRTRSVQTPPNRRHLPFGSISGDVDLLGKLVS